ncbi:MAG: ABC transporter permease [Alphaproteobacteria bacterium]|nr:ABC transporter permease [Alphaproteobacteria bacterium]
MVQRIEALGRLKTVVKPFDSGRPSTTVAFRICSICSRWPAAVVLLFVAANLAVGITFSTVARNHLQAMQMAIFFFLPSIMLSSFVFPFRGMPGWAQWIGEILPITNFLRVVRGVMLKGGGWSNVAPDVWPIAAFFLVAVTIALVRYRRTLD